MRMKQMHRRILEGCLACLLCFTCSIPAFAAETATPSNADERREILPDLESEAPGHRRAEPRKHRKKYPSSLSQKYKMKANCSPCQISPCPLEPHRLMMTWRKFISWPFGIKPSAPL